MPCYGQKIFVTKYDRQTLSEARHQKRWARKFLLFKIFFIFEEPHVKIFLLMGIFDNMEIGQGIKVGCVFFLGCSTTNKGVSAYVLSMLLEDNTFDIK